MVLSELFAAANPNSGGKAFAKSTRAYSLALVLVLCRGSAWPQEDQKQNAFLLEKQGRAAEAEAAWHALSQAQPSDPEPFAHLGLLEAREQHYAEAVAYYRKAMALNPSMPGLRLNLGLALFKEDKYQDAVQALDPLLKTQPPPSPEEAQRLNVLIGMSYYGLGEGAASVPYLERASDKDAQNLPLLLALAHSCLLSKRYQCVLDAYHRLVALNADSAEAHMLVGEALDEMKDSIGATKEFVAAIQANPKEPNAHFGLGYLLWTQKKYEEAAAEFQAELENTPGYVQAMLYLADSYVQINRIEDARTLLEKLVASDPSIAMARLDLGIVYAGMGRNEDAIREFKAAMTLNPDEVNAHWRLARLYRSMGKTAEAKEEFTKAGSLVRAADAALVDAMSKYGQQAGHPQDAAK